MQRSIAIQVFDEGHYKALTLRRVQELLDEFEVFSDTVKDRIAVGQNVEAHDLHPISQQGPISELVICLYRRLLAQYLRYLDGSPHNECERYLNPKARWVADVVDAE